MPPEEEIERIPLLLHNERGESLTSPLDRRSEAYRHAAAEARSRSKEPRPPRQNILTLPNLMTFFRLLMVPVLLVMWERTAPWAPFHCAVVFIAASVTDWLDGFLARKLRLATVFGAFLDPVADKIMVTVALILLTVNPPSPITDKIMVLPVATMICREVTMSALREWAAAAGGAAHKAVKVNSLGKWKTAFQMVSMSLLLLLRQPLELYSPGASDAAFARRDVMVWVSYVGLWASTVMAVWSLSAYMSNVWTHFIYPPEKKSS